MRGVFRSSKNRVNGRLAMQARADIEDAVFEAAAAWHAQAARDDCDWTGLTRWLESDRSHRIAFDQVALIDQLVGRHSEQLELVVDKTVAPRWQQWIQPLRRPHFYGALTIVAAMIVGLTQLLPTRADRIISTGQNETRHLALAQGVNIDLAPASRIAIRGHRAAGIELLAGEAYFSVAHDPSRKLTIAAGHYRVTDIGTRFAIDVAGDQVRVGVAEGRLTVARADGDATEVSTGEELNGQADGIRISALAPAAIASWRNGQLTYNDTPVSIVASDISRYSGRQITVDATIADQRFSGVLAIGNGSSLLLDFSRLMGLAVLTKGDDNRLVAASGP